MKIAVIIAALLFAAYLFAENNLMLRVRHEIIRKGGIRAVHIADLHKRKFGRDNEKLYRKIAAEKPDIIFISGDLVSRKCTDFSAAESLLKRICELSPVYMVFGNHENDMPDDEKSRFIRTVEGTKAVLLRNEGVQVKFGERTLNVLGAELKRSVYKVNDSYRRLEKTDCAELTAMLGEKPQGETILLAHNPFFAEVYAEWGADFAVAGHVHGGAVMIPFTRIGVLSPERRFFPKYSKGVYNVGGMKLLLSGGLGKLRLFNPPEIVVYEL